MDFGEAKFWFGNYKTKATIHPHGLGFRVVVHELYQSKFRLRAGKKRTKFCKHSVLPVFGVDYMCSKDEGCCTLQVLGSGATGMFSAVMIAFILASIPTIRVQKSRFIYLNSIVRDVDGSCTPLPLPEMCDTFDVPTGCFLRDFWHSISNSISSRLGSRCNSAACTKTLLHFPALIRHKHGYRV